MRVVILEESKQKSQQMIAAQMARNLAWEKGFPVYLCMAEKEEKVMPWHNVKEIIDKFEIEAA